MKALWPKRLNENMDYLIILSFKNMDLITPIMTGISFIFLFYVQRCDTLNK